MRGGPHSKSISSDLGSGAEDSATQHGAVIDPKLRKAFELITMGIHLAQQAGFTPANAADAAIQIRELGRLDAMLSSLQIEQLAAIETSECHTVAGHHHPHYMVRHHANTSAREAVVRSQCRRAFQHLPTVQERHAHGLLSRSQVRAIAAAFVTDNGQVREAIVDNERQLSDAATGRSVKDFDAYLKRFVERADQDTAFDETERRHRKRSAQMHRDRDNVWQAQANFGDLAGTAMHEILERYYEAETLVDWEKARAEHGANATATHLARSRQQRYADALTAIFHDAVTNRPGGKRPRFIINLVMDYKTFQRELALLAGQTLDPDDPGRFDFRSHTLDGVAVNPREVVAELVAGGLEMTVRRAVVDAKSVVIDLGAQRSFTGSARLAALLPHDHCVWPGCHTRLSHCQIDHLDPWSASGPSSQENATPMCGHHNRFKHQLYERGYTVRRNPIGEIELLDRHGRPVRIE